MASTCIEEGLAVYLASKTELTAIIGTRLEPMKLAQTLKKPYLVYEEMEDKPKSTSLNGCSPLMEAVYKLLAVSDKELDVNAIKKVLRGYFLTPAFHTLDTYTSCAIYWLNSYHEKEPPFMASDIYPYSKSCFIRIIYDEP